MKEGKKEKKEEEKKWNEGRKGTYQTFPSTYSVKHALM